MHSLHSNYRIDILKDDDDSKHNTIYKIVNYNTNLLTI